MSTFFLNLEIEAGELTENTFLVVKSDDMELAMKIGNEIYEQYGCRVLVLSTEASVEFVDEEYMEKLGWYRKDLPQTINERFAHK